MPSIRAPDGYAGRVCPPSADVPRPRKSRSASHVGNPVCMQSPTWHRIPLMRLSQIYITTAKFIFSGLLRKRISVCYIDGVAKSDPFGCRDRSGAIAGPDFHRPPIRPSGACLIAGSAARNTGPRGTSIALRFGHRRRIYATPHAARRIRYGIANTAPRNTRKPRR